MFGSDGATRMNELKKGFEKGKKETVTVKARDVGKLEKVQLHTSDPDGWFVETLKITDSDKVALGDFDFNRWVQKPESGTVSSTRSIEYKMKVKTGNLPDSDSKGQFFIKLFGVKGETKRLPLSTGFKKGAESKLVIRGHNVGDIEKVQLSTDSTDGWLCETMEITPTGGNPYPFPANVWVQHPGKASVDVLAGINYQISVRTGSLPGADTKGSAYITLFGPRGSTPKLLLGNLKAGMKMGSYKTFRVPAANVGRVTSVKVSMEDKDKWLCETVSIQGDSAKAPVLFRLNKYIGKPHLPAAMARADSLYVFSLTTGSSARAASTASVSIRIAGHLATTRKMHLKTGFARGSTATVKLKAVDVGKVLSLQLETTDEDDIHLERVALQVTSSAGSSTQYAFAANKWLKAPLFGAIDLYGIAPYTVSVDTGKAANAGMMAPAYLTIFGNLGATSKNVMRAPFTPSSVRHFSYWQPMVGQVTSIRLETYGTEQWTPTNVALQVGGIVYVCPITSVVSAATGGTAAPAKLQYYLIKDRSITGTAGKSATIKKADKATPASCMSMCGASADCKSIAYDKKTKTCMLFKANRDSKGVGFDFKWTKGFNYYEKLRGSAKGKGSAPPKKPAALAQATRDEHAAVMLDDAADAAVALQHV
jgi:hypothetical protein